MEIVGICRSGWLIDHPGERKIYCSSGLIRHIEKRHPDMVRYFDLIGEVISEPDYIGHNPREPRSFELVKILDKNLLVAIKLDSQAGYLYVASLYSITDSTLNHRLKNGRLKPLDKIE